MLNRRCHQSVLFLKKTDKTDSLFELEEPERSANVRVFHCRLRGGELICRAEVHHREEIISVKVAAE